MLTGELQRRPHNLIHRFGRAGRLGRERNHPRDGAHQNGEQHRKVETGQRT